MYSARGAPSGAWKDNAGNLTISVKSVLGRDGNGSDSGRVE
jgi:hypothetical protein